MTDKTTTGSDAASAQPCTCPSGDGSLRWPCPQHPPTGSDAVDLDKLEALARAATPGPWERIYGRFDVVAPKESKAGMDRYHVCAPSGRSYSQMTHNADFIAAANPTAILGLIALTRQTHEKSAAIKAHQSVLTEWQSGPVPEGSAFYAYHPSLVHADFNPWGVVEAAFDGEKVVGAVWNGAHDCWDTLPVEVELWRPISGPNLIAPAAHHHALIAQARAAAPAAMSKAQIDAIVYKCRQEGKDTTYDIVNAALAVAPVIAAPTATSEPVAAFPERDLSKPAEQQGLFRKFEVRRVDGSDQPGGKHHGCRYYVLDLNHDQHAPAAMRAYAASCRATHPQLADDIEAEFAAPAPQQAAPLTDAPKGWREVLEGLRPDSTTYTHDTEIVDGFLDTVIDALEDLEYGNQIVMHEHGNLGEMFLVAGGKFDGANWTVSNSDLPAFMTALFSATPTATLWNRGEPVSAGIAASAGDSRDGQLVPLMAEALKDAKKLLELNGVDATDICDYGNGRADHIVNRISSAIDAAMAATKEKK